MKQTPDFPCHVVYILLGWCRGNIHGQGAFVDQTIVAFSKFGSHFKLGAIQFPVITFGVQEPYQSCRIL